jgi:RNA polymerase sigma factor (sigma-70 family)
VHKPAEIADEDLIRSSRHGDRTALETLYNRHHDAGLRFARRLMGNKADAEDVAQDAFLKVAAAIERGNGPGTAFRPYFLRAVRTAAADRWESQVKETPTDNTGDTPVEDASLASVLHRDDPELVMRAFQSLPVRWMTVLWHVEVEREPPRKIAPILGLEPGAVSALLMRARKGLREAYLTAYADAPMHSDCEPTFPYLASTVLGTSSSRDRRKVNEHTRDCEDCAKVVAQLSDVGATMRGIVAPVVILSPDAGTGGIRFPLHNHAPLRRAGTAVAAGMVTLAAGAMAAVAIAGGLVPDAVPSAAPTTPGTVLSRAIPPSPGPPLADTSATPPASDPLPVEESASPGFGDQADPLMAAQSAARALPQNAPALVLPLESAASPRAATETDLARPTTSPTFTPTSTPAPTPSTPTPPVVPADPPTEPNCNSIFDLCLVL